MNFERHPVAVALFVSLALFSGCSIRRLAINRVADTLSGSGTTFSSDNDPELIRDAAPFSLKLMESLLVEAPNHDGLVTSLASGFTQFAYGFVQQEADRVEETDLDRAKDLQARARNLYVRGRDYALRGLEARHPGFTNALLNEFRSAVVTVDKRDVPLLYWAGASWAGAISMAKDDPGLVSDLPKVEALLYRALELDEAWNRGAIHTLLITYEMSRTTGEGDPAERARRHFERARHLGQDRLAAPLVSYAEAVCVPLEDREQFVKLLREARGIDVNGAPESRIENLVLQRRASWLLDRVDQLFLPPLESHE